MNVPLDTPWKIKLTTQGVLCDLYEHLTNSGKDLNGLQYVWEAVERGCDRDLPVYVIYSKDDNLITVQYEEYYYKASKAPELQFYNTTVFNLPEYRLGSVFEHRDFGNRVMLVGILFDDRDKFICFAVDCATGRPLNNNRVEIDNPNPEPVNGIKIDPEHVHFLIGLNSYDMVTQ